MTKNEILKTAYKQRKTLEAQISNLLVPCGNHECDNVIDIITQKVYKCFYCGIYFCKRCAKEHFEKGDK